jgi:RsiW-degrading membrane proteinase PrsW (M82 family)
MLRIATFGAPDFRPVPAAATLGVMLVGLLLGALGVTPFVLLYALFVRWVDRFEPEPTWLLLLAFFYGAGFATFAGGVSSHFVQGAAASLFGVGSSSAGMEAFGATVLAPLFEETFKGLGLCAIALGSAAGLHELDGALDGVIYGGIIGLGFTLTEDILYVATTYAERGFNAFAGLLFVRTVLLGLSHCTFTAMTGLGFGIAAEVHKPWMKVAAPVVGFGVAVGLHALHNGLPTFFGGTGTLAMILFTWLTVILFFVLVAALVARDRALVVRELQTEVGALLHAKELVLVSSYVTLGMRNVNVLFATGLVAFRHRRAKQLALVELAFVKHRRRRGQSGTHLDAREAALRGRIAEANRLGIWLGS